MHSLWKNKFVAAVVAITCILQAQAVQAIQLDSTCVQKAEHSAVSYLLIDRSDVLENTQNLKQSILVVRQMLEPGERLLVGISTGKASETRIVMDMVRPKKSIWVSKLKFVPLRKNSMTVFQRLRNNYSSKMKFIRHLLS